MDFMAVEFDTVPLTVKLSLLIIAPLEGDVIDILGGEIIVGVIEGWTTPFNTETLPP